MCLASHLMSFLFHHLEAASPEARFSCLTSIFPSWKQEQKCCPSPGIPRGHQGMRIPRPCCLPPTEAEPHTGSENVPGPGIPVVITGRVISGLSQKAGIFCLDCFFTWMSLQLSEPLSLHLSRRPFHQMTRGVPSQLPSLQILEFVPKPSRHLTPSITLAYGNVSPGFLPKLPRMEKKLKCPWKSGSSPSRQSLNS